MEETRPVMNCDPKAVRSAKVPSQSGRQTEKNRRVDNLQKALYKFVTDKSKITLQEISAEFNHSPVKAQTHLANIM
jgi:hypothetical protein